MRYFMRALLVIGFGSGICAGANAQSADYPPASGQMEYNPPVFPGPGAVGGQYLEVFPSYGAELPSVPPVIQPVAPGAQPARPRLRARVPKGARTYSRGYGQATVPSSAPLPHGQLHWSGSFLAPDYAPFARFQTYGWGYEQSPYGSNFYGGYYKGFLLAD